MLERKERDTEDTKSILYEDNMVTFKVCIDGRRTLWLKLQSSCMYSCRRKMAGKINNIISGTSRIRNNAFNSMVTLFAGKDYESAWIILENKMLSQRLWMGTTYAADDNSANSLAGNEAVSEITYGWWSIESGRECLRTITRSK